MTICAAKALNCTAEATHRIRIHGEWHPFCTEHTEDARRISAEQAMRLSNGVTLVYVLEVEPLG